MHYIRQASVLSIVLAIPRGWRPVPSRSFKRTMAIHLFRHLIDSLDKVGLNEPNHENLEGKGGVWVNPKPNLIVGDLKTWASVSSVEPVRIPRYFYFPQRSSGTSSRKVIYSLHGGYYFMGSAHPSAVNANIPRALLEDADSTDNCVLPLIPVVETYPLETANPFPAAIIDAISGYNFLISERGILPSDIIVEGDSAGGNLALALARYLVENRIPGLPPPSGLLLLSPWCDVGTSHDVHPSSIRILKADIDPEPQRGMDYAKGAFLGPHGMGAADLNPYISPASLHLSMTVSFKGFPKTFICAGETENLLPQIRLLRDRMTRDLGKRNVSYFEGKDEPHDYLIFPWLSVTWEETLQEIAQWIMNDVQY
ncbi:hypothetical protein MPER_11895 [Moniliophthora perniciosa FA553]|nr:hypothetical protein MPER_11895 [Moniliophthora perniciosa FA553]